MALCIDLGYEVITDTENVPESGSSAKTTFRLTAPTGKKSISGGVRFVADSPQDPDYQLMHASYPDGNDWVFIMRGISQTGGYDVQLYAVCVNT